MLRVFHRRAWLIAALLMALSIRVGSAQSGFYDEQNVPQIRLLFAMSNWHDRLVENHRQGNGAYVEADLIVNGVLLAGVGVEHKGDTSYKGDLRENMKITLDAFVPGQEYHGIDKITLDAAIQSNVFSEVAALWGLADFQVVPRANLAHLIAGTATNPYDLGVFTNTERVEGRFIDRHFIGDGHRYWGSKTVRPLGYLGDKVEDYYDAYLYQGGDHDSRFTELAGASIALENASRRSAREALEPFFDVDACMRNVVGNRMLGNPDGFETGNNYYIVESARHLGRMSPIVWDLDLSFERGPDNPVPEAGDTPDFPLKKVFLHRHAAERAHAFVRHYLAGPFESGRLAARLEALEDRALPCMLGSPFDPLNTEQKADAAVARCVNWIESTRARLEVDPLYTRALPKITRLRHEPSEPIDTDRVRVFATIDLSSVTPDEVLLWSRTQGGFAEQSMHDDGQHQDGAAGDGIYAARLPPLIAGDIVQYYVELRPVDPTTHHYAFVPEKTAFEPREVRIRLARRDTLRLNEVLADNEDTDFDEWGEAEDWIEIVNGASQALDLSGAFLTDDVLRPRKWPLPAGASIPAHGWLRVWADGEAEDGPFHAGFRLAKDGGTIQLRSPESLGAALLDELDYGPQKEDRSFARIPDGGDFWFHTWNPSGESAVLNAGESNRYDARRDGSKRGFKLKIEGGVEAGKTIEFELRGGRAHATAMLWIGLAPDTIDLGDLGVLAVDLGISLLLRITLDSSGEADWTGRIPDALAGLRFYAQAFDQDFSNAVTAWVDD